MKQAQQKRRRRPPPQDDPPEIPIVKQDRAIIIKTDRLLNKIDDTLQNTKENV